MGNSWKILIGATIMGVAGLGATALFMRPDASHTAEPLPVKRGSRLDVPDTMHLGLVRYGAVVPYSILIRNESSSAETIAEIFTDCGCTTVARAPITIGPGQAETIEGQFATKKSLAVQASWSTVTLVSDDGTAHQVRLRADLQAPLVSRAYLNEHAVTLNHNALYAGVIDSATCYADDSTAPLPLEFDRVAGVLVVSEIPEGTAALQVVLRIAPDGDAAMAYELLQEIVLEHGAEVGAGSLSQ